MASPKKTATGRWHIQIEVAGVRESGTFDTYREATAWAHARSTELRATKRGTIGQTKTLRDAIVRYQGEIAPGMKGGDKEVIRLTAMLGPGHRLPLGKKLGEITPEDMAVWRDDRLRVNSDGSVLRYITVLSSVFEAARRDWRWVDTNPLRDMRKPSKPAHRERTISGVEVRKMLRQLGWRRGPVQSVTGSIANALVLALLTGMRAGEMCALQWPDIGADFCRLRTSKTGKGRDVPLTPTALRVIGWQKGFDSVTVFGVTTQTLDTLFRRARDRAGLSGFTFHDSRHTAATRLAQRLHVLDLCKMFGWSNTTRALTYYNPTASEIAARITGGTPTR